MPPSLRAGVVPRSLPLFRISGTVPLASAPVHDVPFMPTQHLVATPSILHGCDPSAGLRNREVSLNPTAAALAASVSRVSNASTSTQFLILS